ncbi:MAG: ABC transporter permease, partial [Bacteroidota bacterium]
MFATIFRYELRHWFTSISLYFYWSIFLVLGFLIMGSQSGLIEGAPPNTNEVPLVNSPFAMFSSGNYLNSFWIFLLPIIVGMGLFRDFRSRTHYLLYSFPTPKSQYWLAKFSSSFLAVCFVLSGCGIGFVLGCYLPGAIPELVTPLEWSAYLQWYGLFLLPNALVMGFLVFVAVAWSRNIYLGFIVIILLLFIQSMAAMLPVDLDDLTWSALLDPMGKTAAFWMAEEWSIAEQNRALFPLTGILGQNRLLWLGLGFFIFGLGYSRFQMTHHGRLHWTWKNQKDKTSPASFTSVQRQLDMPQADLSFDLKGRWQQLWTLIQSDFRYLMTSPIFLIIVGVGTLFVLFIFYQVDSGFRSPSLPLTYRMLEIPGTFFGLIMNLLTFLFAGLLIQRGRMHQMNHLIDVNPVSDRALLASKFWALTLMQIVLLGVLFLGGIIYQVSQGYYQFELGHYAFELGVIRLANMIVWSMAALFVQTLFPNPYLGFFLLVCGAAGMAYLPDLGIEQAVFRYNQGPNFVLTYSDMDGYGRDLIPYLSYKLYWSLGGMVLLGLSWALW